MIVDLNCMVCGETFKGEEPRMCCNGDMCGCMGMPEGPVICGIECYYGLPMFNHLTEEERAQHIAIAYANDPGLLL